MTKGLIATAEGDRSIVFTRDFAAPRALVWRAMTEPALVMRWLFVSECPMVRCEQDFRVGGALRWEWAMPDSKIMGVSGIYRQIEAPALVIHTELFDQDWTGGETLVTMRLSERGPALTAMRMVVDYAGTAGRDGALASPMAEGMEEGYARLETLLPAFAD